mmetsp:Transcript_26630/g.86226  ORF Transcript_26630/g.86226 Transcript_26630/m.86226 type:complete len:246 (+) Transcript_26630:1184-1921(+)
MTSKSATLSSTFCLPPPSTISPLTDTAAPVDASFSDVRSSSPSKTHWRPPKLDPSWISRKPKAFCARTVFAQPFTTTSRPISDVTSAASTTLFTRTRSATIVVAPRFSATDVNPNAKRGAAVTTSHIVVVVRLRISLPCLRKCVDSFFRRGGPQPAPSSLPECSLSSHCRAARPAYKARMKQGLLERGTTSRSRGGAFRRGASRGGRPCPRGRGSRCWPFRRRRGRRSRGRRRSGGCGWVTWTWV